MEPRCLLAGGTIQGIAWNDLNGDSQLEAGEPLLAGWGIFLDANHNSRFDQGETTTTTNSDGSYTFTNLTPGNYLIGTILKPGWRQTYPLPTLIPTGAPAATTPDSINAAITRVTDPSQYDTATLNSASGWVVGLNPGTAITSVASISGATSSTANAQLPGSFILNFPADFSGTQISSNLAQTAGLSYFYPLVARAQQDRAAPNDPLFPQQWYLNNTLPTGNLPGADANVLPIWDKYQGNGVTVAVVDDGVQYTHPDLSANYDAFDSYDFDDNDTNPINFGNHDQHGTAVTGIIAARGNNGIGISGVAPQARYAAIRLTDIDTNDQQESGALSFHNKTADPIDIYSNSWGPEDDGMRLEGPGPMTLAAMKDSVTNGRGGKGSIYVWAAGNGLQVGDNVNYDGYANSRYVIATTALDEAGKQAYYAEPGAPIFIAASGAGDTPGITTTDLRGTQGFDPTDYTNDFGGTSASAPIVSGVVALMLQANPNLTWRDVKHILADTAQKNDPTDPGWSLNGGQHWINDKYGFGAVDATAAVQAAVNWTNVAPETSVSAGPIVIDRTIPDNNTTGLSSSVTIDRLIDVETVEVVFDAEHPVRGDLRVVLTSPNGTQSILAAPHGDPNANYTSWTFTTNRDWDEISKGTWTLTVTDEAGGNVGEWTSWKLNIYGSPITSEQYVNLTSSTSVAGANFGVRPLPGAHVAAVNFPFQSGPMRLIFAFDRDVGSSITADDLELKNDTTGQIIASSLTHVDYTAGTRTATWTFPGFARGILPDGNYTARLKASQITVTGGGMLDGNNDGLGGDDYLTTFFELKGDANHDRIVDNTDLKILMRNLGASNATLEQGDLNYDGKVDFRDFQAMELTFGHKLSAPVPGGGQTAPVYATNVAATTKPTPAAPLVVSQPLFSTQPIRRKMDLLETATKRG